MSQDRIVFDPDGRIEGEETDQMKNSMAIEHGGVRMVAHRGLSGLEKENTCAAFVAAGVRSYFGIETDVHVTADGKYILCHDHDLKRVAGGVPLELEQSEAALLQSVPLLDTDGVSRRSDLFPPTLQDYILICRKYEKESFLELKGEIDERHVAEIVGIVREMGHFERTTFISFSGDNLRRLRATSPDAKMQFLAWKVGPGELRFMEETGAGADVDMRSVTKEAVDAVHAIGRDFNVWTVNTPEDAARMIACGVDCITTNILE